MSMTEIATTVKERADASVEALTTALTEAQEVARTAAAMKIEDPIPTEFIGIIRNYRYGKSDQDDMPRHFFEVECDNGLWLHSICPSPEFDNFIKETNIAMLESASVLNGKVVRVRRGAKALLPMKLLGEPCEGRDVNNNFLYIGCRAMLEGGKEVEILSDRDNGIVAIRYKDGTENNVYANTVRKI